MNEKECRSLLKSRSCGLCERCGRSSTTTLHHRKKKSQGGTWSVTNCVSVCGDGVRGCHGWIESNPEAAHEQGWHVRPWEDPAEIPICIGDARGYLHEDGDVTWRL